MVEITPLVIYGLLDMMVDLEHCSLGNLGLLKIMVENTPLLIYGLNILMVLFLKNYRFVHSQSSLHLIILIPETKDSDFLLFAWVRALLPWLRILPW